MMCSNEGIRIREAGHEEDGVKIGKWTGTKRLG
jgi:hypothetical protein